VITPPDALLKLLEPWTNLYNDSKLVETLVMFGHVGGLLIAGGIAISTDRGTLRAATWTDADRRRHLDEMGLLHRTVIVALGITLLSGAMLAAADLGTFWGSWIYWVKMLLVVLLLANGARMQSVEKRLHEDPVATSPHWGSLRTTAITSLVLWISITFAGVALLNYA
jgi:uncharacterized membrane protein